MNHRHPSHFTKAINLVEAYSNQIPFPIYLHQQFQKNRNWGSKDRKTYRELCYLILKNFPYFKDQIVERKIQILKELDSGICPMYPDPYENLKSIISDFITLSDIPDWFHPIPPVYFFSWEEMSETNQYLPKDARLISANIVEFKSNASLESGIMEGRGIVQDISSSQVVMYWGQIFQKSRIWDCCSGAGGKSLIIKKMFTPERLLCSDIRENILMNLKKRFITNGITDSEVSCIDLETTDLALEENIKGIKVVFADVPCTGSGTWRRNPENLIHFNLTMLTKYTERQQRILAQIGRLDYIETIIYCTCSLFKDENENQIAEFLLNNPAFECIEQRYFGEVGTIQKGDYLYAALLQRKNQ